MSASVSSGVPVVEGHLQKESDEKVVLDVSHTDYQLHLVPTGAIDAAAGAMVRGVIRLQARRADVVPAGGRYIEPVYGRPRRVQGTIVGGDVSANELYVNAGVGVVVSLMPSQQAKDFALGQMVSFDAERGATFELVSPGA